MMLEYALRECGGQKSLENEALLEHISSDRIPVKVLSVVTKRCFLLLFAIVIDAVILVPRVVEIFKKTD